MFVLLNPFASSGNANKKWKLLEPHLRFRRNSYDYYIIKDYIIDSKLIKKAIERGEKHYVAAGGDGTINYLLNLILKFADPSKLKNISLGAIGLGSSNDFHKPFENLINNTPCKFNFNTATKRDVGYLKYSSNNKAQLKYFLINASIGLTAEGNYFFNHPNKVLSVLKKLNSSLAIYYTALNTIFKYQNINAKIECDEKNIIETRISNFGIAKNPHFSGNLSYPLKANYDNGFLNIHLSENLSKINSLLLLWKLGHLHANNDFLTTWKTKNISVWSPTPFNVEFDGETIRTNSIQFGVLPKNISVCSS